VRTDDAGDAGFGSFVRHLKTQMNLGTRRNGHDIIPVHHDFVGISFGADPDGRQRCGAVDIVAAAL
jgi:hypothetical protein